MIIHPQFIVDAQGKRRSVILSIEEFHALLAELEDFQDAKRASEILEHSKPEDFEDWEAYSAQLRSEGKLT
jgi:hypothetical protein